VHVTLSVQVTQLEITTEQALQAPAWSTVGLLQVKQVDASLHVRQEEVRGTEHD